MTVDTNGNYIRGLSKTVDMGDRTYSAFISEAFNAPLDMHAFLIKFDQQPCAIGGNKNCSAVTLTVQAPKQLSITNETVTKYPQRDTFRTTTGNSISMDVYDAEFHPMQAGVMTYESDFSLPDTAYAGKAKVVCIFRR